jgi:hypothetical protein
MIPIELDRVRHISFSVNAYRDAETVAGMGIVAMVHPRNIGFKTIQALLWAGLRHEDPTLTLDGVGVLMDLWPLKNGRKFTDLEEIVVQAIEEHGWFSVAKMAKSAKNSTSGSRKSTSP